MDFISAGGILGCEIVLWIDKALHIQCGRSESMWDSLCPSGMFPRIFMIYLKPESSERLKTDDTDHAEDASDQVDCGPLFSLDEADEEKCDEHHGLDK